jgi:hypothetical protein
MAETQKRGLSWAWANHPWALVLGAVILGIPAALVAEYLITSWLPAESRRNERPPTQPENLQEGAGESSEPTTSLQPVKRPPQQTGPAAEPASEPDPEPEPPPVRTAERDPGRAADEPVATVELPRPNPAVERPRPPPEPRLRQAGCPATHATLRFDWPEPETRAFVSLGAVELVTLHDCESATGRFATLLAKESGALEGLQGSSSGESLQMQFGYRSNNGWGNIICSLSADAAAPRQYRSQVSCNASGRRGTATTAAAVSVRL